MIALGPHSDVDTSTRRLYSSLAQSPSEETPWALAPASDDLQLDFVRPYYLSRQSVDHLESVPLLVLPRWLLTHQPGKPSWLVAELMGYHRGACRTRQDLCCKGSANAFFGVSTAVLCFGDSHGLEYLDHGSMPSGPRSSPVFDSTFL